MDAASFGDGGWLVLDWKTDDVGEVEWAKRRDAYERQVSRYAEILTALGGAPAVGEIVRARH